MSRFVRIIVAPTLLGRSLDGIIEKVVPGITAHATAQGCQYIGRKCCKKLGTNYNKCCEVLSCPSGLVCNNCTAFDNHCPC